MTAPAGLDDLVAGWEAPDAAAGVLALDGRRLAGHGDMSRPSRWASITKLATALAALVAFEEGTLDLDEAAGPPGSTVRHLLAHASGLAFDDDRVLAEPGRRRTYSNTGYRVLGATVADRAGMAFERYLTEAVLEPLALDRTSLEGSAAAGLVGPLHDLLGLAAELGRPTLVSPETLALATTVTFPGLAGVLPGVGRYDPLDWGLGFELRDGKSSHWTGARNSARTYGHFGGSGSFLWVDPDAGLACAALSRREFGPWALRAWPSFSDAVLDRFAGAV